MPFRPLPTHLLDGATNDAGMTTPRALCGTWNPRRSTREVQAVTCPQCISATELSPA